MLLVIATNNFVKRQSVYYEQPNVKFTNELIVEALVNDGIVDAVKQFSTVENINTEFTTLITNPQLSVNSYNQNDDLKNERIEIEFEMAKLSTDTVKSLHFLFYLQYYIGNEINTQMKTVVYVEIDAPNGANIGYTQMKGELKLVQKNPIAEGTIKRSLYDSTLEDDYFSYGISGILDRYSYRNQTTTFKASPIVTTYGSTTSTKVKLILVVPTVESIWYYTSVLELVKYAWIQYLAIFIPVYYILYILLFGFVVKNNVLQ